MINYLVKCASDPYGSGGFYMKELFNKRTSTQQVLSRKQNLVNNLVDNRWVSMMKNPANGFTDDNKIDIHVSDNISKPFKKYSKRIIRKIDDVTGIKIKIINNVNKSDIIVENVNNYDQFGMDDNVNGLAYLDLSNMKMRATWLKVWNICDYNSNKNKCKVWNYTKTLITHEILHTLGLSHPFGDGSIEGYDNTDTAMSYNFVDFSINNPLRRADVMALQSIWG